MPHEDVGLHQASYGWQVIEEDVCVLRALFSRKREIAADPIMDERRRLWRLHASLQGQRPMILTETQGLLEELFGDILPVQNRGSYWWTTGLTWTAIELIGLQPAPRRAQGGCPAPHSDGAGVGLTRVQSLLWARIAGSTS